MSAGSSPAAGNLLRRCLAAGFALLCASIGGAADADGARVAQRAEYQQALARVAAAPDGAANDSASLRRYLLYPYLQAARLAQSLRVAGANVPDALDQQIAAFLQGRDNEPVAQELRRSWLASLATRARWQEFLAWHQDAKDGAALRCHGFTARIELQREAGMAPSVTQAWLTPRSLPECERAFSWLEQSGNLGAALIEQRVRLALRAGNAAFARQIMARLPAPQVAPLQRWAALLDNPQREIDALITAPHVSVEPEALLAGWTKLARANPAAARPRLEPLVQARRMTAREASPYALAVALPVSWNREVESLRYFSRVDPADFDDTAREWQVRAALWAGDWKLAAAGIAAMSTSSRQSARWRYWSARAAQQDGDEALARQAYESLLAEDNYYSAMAAARLGRMVTPNLQRLPEDAGAVASVEAQPAFLRARELLLTGSVEQARAEWSFGQEPLPTAVRPQLIHVASRWGWHHQAVSVATSERVFFDYVLLYPRPYDNEVGAAAQVSGLPPHLIYGVVRQESLYQQDAVSSAGARGLMQLLLDTARRTARQWNRPAPTAPSLFDPAVNVMLGATHLKDLIDRFDGQLPVALAAYNAGPGAAQRWLPAGPIDPDIWIENIPYNETRAYVQRILWHSIVFNWLRNGEATDTRTWLAPISP